MSTETPKEPERIPLSLEQSKHLARLLAERDDAWERSNEKINDFVRYLANEHGAHPVDGWKRCTPEGFFKDDPDQS